MSASTTLDVRRVACWCGALAKSRKLVLHPEGEQVSVTRSTLTAMAAHRSRARCRLTSSPPDKCCRDSGEARGGSAYRRRGWHRVLSRADAARALADPAGCGGKAGQRPGSKFSDALDSGRRLHCSSGRAYRFRDSQGTARRNGWYLPHRRADRGDARPAGEPVSIFLVRDTNRDLALF